MCFFGMRGATKRRWVCYKFAAAKVAMLFFLICVNNNARNKNLTIQKSVTGVIQHHAFMCTHFHACTQIM